MKKVSIIDVFINKLLRKLFYLSKKYHLPQFLQNSVCSCHFNFLRRILLPYIRYTLKNMKNIKYEGSNNSKIIWIFWWQGYSKMPLVVKKCIESIIELNKSHKIILITKNNVNRYINIPNYIYDKLHSNQITLTQFSDIVRFTLLDKYGGLWCDSTLYCVSSLDNKYFDYLYTSGGQYNTYPRFANGRWSTFLIGGNKSNKLFTFMRNLLITYWGINKYQISYFISDFGLYYAYTKNIGDFRMYVNKEAQSNNPNIWKLNSLMSHKYSSIRLKEISKDTDLFKLTYKDNYNNDLSNNDLSFYSYLILGKGGK